MFMVVNVGCQWMLLMDSHDGSAVHDWLMDATSLMDVNGCQSTINGRWMLMDINRC